MDEELGFRIAFTILWLIFIANLTWVRYSLSRSQGRASIGRMIQKVGLFHVMALLLFAPFWFGGIILYIFIPGWIAFLSIPLPVWLRAVMALVSALSIPFVLWSYRTLGRNWVHALEPSTFKKKQGELVTRGPYAYVRNPIYLGSFVFIIAMALLASNWLLLLPALVLITIVYAQIANEEDMLVDKFGDEYRQYMRRTPRLFPRIIDR